MGYCIQQLESKIHISAANMPKVLDALNALARRGERFSWVSPAILAQARTVKEHLEEWRWRSVQDASGNIVALHFEGEKLGSDKTLFNAIAPYVTARSHIVMQGEDGETWRWYFDGSKCHEERASFTFASAGDSDVIDVEAREVTNHSSTPRLPL